MSVCSDMEYGMPDTACAIINYILNRTVPAVFNHTYYTLLKYG